MRQFFISKKRALEEFLEEYWMYTTPVILLVGFFIHTFTFREADRLFEHVMLMLHMCIIGTTTALIFSQNTRFGRRHKIAERQAVILALMLFSFGNLFGGFLIFYAKSGSLISSWPFILLLLALMLGPELRKGYYKKPVLQITIFYIAIFSYLIFSVPVVIKQIGAGVYLLSGGISLIVIGLYLSLLSRIDRPNLMKYRSKLVVRIASIFIIFNALYFTNVIPPIPLSLKFRAVYHDMSKVQAVEYRGFYEETPRWVFWKKRSNVFHRISGEPVYVYTQIYAPVNLDTDIYHKWEYFDPEKTRWMKTDEVKIHITGGRESGYRGFSKKTNLEAGSWRVMITTSRGQVIGQIHFKVVDASSPPELAEETFR